MGEPPNPALLIGLQLTPVGSICFCLKSSEGPRLTAQKLITSPVKRAGKVTQRTPPRRGGHSFLEAANPSEASPTARHRVGSSEEKATGGGGGGFGQVRGPHPSEEEPEDRNGHELQHRGEGEAQHRPAQGLFQ